MVGRGCFDRHGGSEIGLKPEEWRGFRRVERGRRNKKRVRRIPERQREECDADLSVPIQVSLVVVTK